MYVTHFLSINTCNRR